MTACIYISPGNVPALIADTVVTVTNGNGQVNQDCQFARSSRYGVVRATLARKVFIIDNRTCVAVSGDEREILEFLQTCKAVIDFMPDERPLKQISELANGYPSISVIGIHVYPNNDMNKMARDSAWDYIPLYGHSAFCGSGDSELRATFKKWGSESVIERWIPTEFIRGSAAAISAKGLFEEITGAEKSYGSFYEYAFFDHTDQTWRYGSSTSYLYLVAQKNKDSFSLRMTNRMFFYFPDRGGDGCSLFIDDNNKLNVQWIQFVDILNDRPAQDVQQFSIFWSDWKPIHEVCTVIFEDYNGPGCPRLVHKSTELNETHVLSVDFSADRVNFALNHEAIERLGRFLEPALGLRYEHDVD